MSPAVYQSMCNHVNRYLPNRDCRDILTQVFEDNFIAENSYYDRSFDSQLQTTFYKILANSLKTKGFPEAYSFRDSVILYDPRKELKIQTCQALGILSYILRNFGYNDFIKYTTNDIYIDLSLKDGLNADQQRGIILELIKYVYQLVSSNETLVNLYRELQPKFIAYHTSENFDHPSILVLSTLLSTLIQPYGIQTYQSNIDWTDQNNIGFYITFKPLSEFGTEYNDVVRWERQGKEKDWRQNINNILNNAQTQLIKSGFSENGEYVVAKDDLIRNIEGFYSNVTEHKVFLELNNSTPHVNTLPSK